MANQSEEIKNRLDIVELVSEYIRLKQAGTNSWKALCPFHNEKTPSFVVSKDKQIFHCFGCSEGGDIFTFVQKMEGMDFPEALRLLAQKAGVKLVAQDPKLASQKNKILDICQEASRFWSENLKPESAKKINEYLINDRQLNKETTEEFKLGYAHDSWGNMFNHLKSKGFNEQEIFLAGLTVKKERGQGFYDRFRGRLMFPINDAHGSPVGFSARALKTDEKGGKYINTPQTLVYNKSLVIYNLDKAKEYIKKNDYAIVVEGQMDVLAAWQAGTKNVIAASGTAFTLDQLKLLKRYTKNIKIAFDTDVAGESAAKRGIALALSEDLNVKIIVLPDGKDPDDVIKADKKVWEEANKNAKSIMDYYFDQTLDRINLGNVEGKKEAAKILLPIINKISNKIEQTHWLQKLSSLLNVTESILRESLPKSEPEKSPEKTEATVQVTKSRNTMLLEQVLAMVLKYPINLPYLIDNLEPEIFIDDSLNDLYKKLIIYYTEDIDNNIDNFDYQEFHNKLKADSLDVIADKLVLLAEKDFFDFDSEIIRDELIKATKFCKENHYNFQLKEIEGQIKTAENKGESEEVKKLIEQFNQVIAQLNVLE